MKGERGPPGDRRSAALQNQGIIDVGRESGGYTLVFKRKQVPFFSSHLDGYIEDLNTGDLRAIPSIFCVFVENMPAHKKKAAQTLAAFLSHSTFEQIAEAGTRMRQTQSISWSINWQEERIDDFITSKMSQEERRAVVIFSTFSPNGYIRQRAVEQLGKFEATLPFVIPRLNDWVKEVRQTAFDSFSKGLKVVSEQELLQSISLMDRMRRSTRCAYFEITNLFDSIINDPKNEHIVEDGLFDPNPGIRNACCRILLRSPEINLEILRKYILREKDPISRKTVFESLIKADLDVSDLADTLLTDKYFGVRYTALTYLDDVERKDIFRKAELLLTDKNTFVRERSRSIISKIDPGFDFLKFYMDRRSTHTAVAILGLGEVGSPAICEVIENYLMSDRISVIRASMLSLMRLDPRRYGPVILEMLLSEHVGIVKTAKNMIQKYDICDFDRIDEIFSMTPYGSTKMKCAALLFSAGKWQRMIYILRFMSDEHEPLRNMCRTQFIRWFETYNRSFSTPTEEQKSTIQKLMSEQKSFLSESALVHLRLVLTL